MENKTRKPHINRLSIAKILRRVVNGESTIDEAARYFSVKEATIRGWLRKAGLARRPIDWNAVKQKVQNS